MNRISALSIPRIRELALRYQGLALYTFLNYLDKVLSVAVPLVALWLSKNRALYNQIEYIYAISSIIVAVVELGLRNKMLFGYRDAPDREGFVAEWLDRFLLLNLLYILLGCAAGVVFGLFGGGKSTGLLFFIWVRTLYSAIFSFLSIYYRLVDRPSAIFLVSIGANLSACVLVVLGWAGGHLTLTVVFLSQAMVTLGLAAKGLRRQVYRRVSELGKDLACSLRYAWPIILNVFVVMAVQNFAKIYAQNALSVQEMTRISLAQRMALIVQLGHSSACGYLSKQLFLQAGHGASRKVIILYSAVLALGVVLTILALPLVNRVLSAHLYVGDPVFLLMIVYTLLWCYAAFFELYLNKIDRNVFIPISTLTGAAIFALALWWPARLGLHGIVLGMVLGMAVNFAMILAFLYRNRKGAKHA